MTKFALGKIARNIRASKDATSEAAQAFEATQNEGRDTGAAMADPVGFAVKTASRLSAVEGELHVIPIRMVLVIDQAIRDAPSITGNNVVTSLWAALTWAPRRAYGLFK